MGHCQDICLATAITVQPVAKILIMAKSSVMSAIVTPYMQWRLHEGKQKAYLEVIGLCLVKPHFCDSFPFAFLRLFFGTSYT